VNWELAGANPMLGMQDVIADVTPIDRQHLSRHALIALISPLAMFKKTFAGILHCYFFRRRAIGARLQLAF
jgi:hypothetical protein